MHLSKWGYHADFFVYPVLIATAALRSLWQAPLQAAGSWFTALAVGLLAWTAIEYALHRVPPFRRLHALHHEHPGALIGTPTWLSTPLFLSLWAVLAHEASAPTASGIATGLMAGYIAYGFVHDAVHHRLSRRGSWLHRVFGTRSLPVQRHTGAVPAERRT
jgi:sterol desaturase/sphingolipid hydroxylase (fatty acid hydroxylase superfamily)